MRPAKATGWGRSLLPGIVALTRVRLYGQGLQRFYSRLAAGVDGNKSIWNPV